MNPKIAALSLPEARAHFGTMYRAIKQQFAEGTLSIEDCRCALDAVVEDFGAYLLARDQGLITTPGDEDEEE